MKNFQKKRRKKPKKIYEAKNLCVGERNYRMERNCIKKAELPQKF